MTLDVLNGRKLILGSNSPRRSQLLDELDISYTKKVIPVEEIFPDDMNVKEVAAYLSRLKAEPHKTLLNNDEVVLTADSIVVLDDRILGKPQDENQAIDYILEMSDRSHHVITGVTIMNKVKSITFSETSEVHLLSITEEEAQYYVRKYQPLDKAGAYGIQEWLGHSKIQWIRGTYTNIMGLPTHRVYEELKAFCKS